MHNIIKILLTRSDTSNASIIKSLHENNSIKCLTLPLIEYQNLSFNPQIISQYEHLIITSNYGSRLIINNPYVLTSLEGKYLWIVGKSSADLFVNYKNYIKYVAYDVKDLINNIPESLYNKMLYLSANNITQPLPTTICRQIIYKTSYKTFLGYQEKQYLILGVDWILLYSQNSAKSLIKLFTKYHLLEILKASKVIAISQKVANIVQPYCKEVLWPATASNYYMLELLNLVIKY